MEGRRQSICRWGEVFVELGSAALRSFDFVPRSSSSSSFVRPCWVFPCFRGLPTLPLGCLALILKSRGHSCGQGFLFLFGVSDVALFLVPNLKASA